MPSRKRAALPALDPVTNNAVLIAVRQAAHVLCDRTVLLILLHAHAGACRYADFGERTGLATRLISSRLEQLETQGVIVRVPYSRRPLRHEYHLSHMGLALFDVLALCATWESRAGPPKHGARVAIGHAPCGATETAVEQHCRACGQTVNARDIDLRVSQKEMRQMPAKSTAMRRSTQGLHLAPSVKPVPMPLVLEVLGDKWTIEVLVCAFLRIHQFGDYVVHTGISTNILADRLQRLVGHGLLERVADDQRGGKGSYWLTERGRAFYPVLTAIQAWADDWLSERVRSPVRLHHRPCGKPLSPGLRCGQCGADIGRGNARVTVWVA